MSQIILKIEGGDIVEMIPDGDVKLSFDNSIAFCMGLMENACHQYLEAHKSEAEDLYDSLDSLFYMFMERVFPDIQPRDFDLTDAAVLYAQDMIIAEAEKNGLTYQEALKNYEDKAKEYVRKNSGVLS